MDLKESNSINKAALKAILERILSSELKKENVTIGFHIEVKNGLIESIEWQSNLSRTYDKLTT